MSNILASNNFRQFGPAVWPAIANIYIQMYICEFEKRALLYRDR